MKSVLTVIIASLDVRVLLAIRGGRSSITPLLVFLHTTAWENGSPDLYWLFSDLQSMTLHNITRPLHIKHYTHPLCSNNGLRYSFTLAFSSNLLLQPCYDARRPKDASTISRTQWRVITIQDGEQQKFIPVREFIYMDHNRTSFSLGAQLVQVSPRA